MSLRMTAGKKSQDDLAAPEGAWGPAELPWRDSAPLRVCPTSSHKLQAEPPACSAGEEKRV